MSSRTRVSSHRGVILSVTYDGPCQHGETGICLEWPCAPGDHMGRHGSWGAGCSDIPARWRGMWGFLACSPLLVAGAAIWWRLFNYA